MASGPITSWQINGEAVETVADFISLGSKITTDGDWTHEIIGYWLDMQSFAATWTCMKTLPWISCVTQGHLISLFLIEMGKVAESTL